MDKELDEERFKIVSGRITSVFQEFEVSPLDVAAFGMTYVRKFLMMVDNPEEAAAVWYGCLLESFKDKDS